MLGRSIRRNAILPGEGGMRTFAEAVSLACFGVLANLEPNGKFSLQALDLRARADSIGTAADREQMCVACVEASARLCDLAVADVELTQPLFGPDAERHEKWREWHGRLRGDRRSDTRIDDQRNRESA